MGKLYSMTTNREAMWKLFRVDGGCLVPVTSFCEPTDAADPVTGEKV